MQAALRAVWLLVHYNYDDPDLHHNHTLFNYDNSSRHNETHNHDDPNLHNNQTNDYYNLHHIHSKNNINYNGTP